MPELEKQITEWRQQMVAAGIKTPVPLEELENHLRDHIERQMRTGISGQAAFDVAVERLGRADVLKTEFKRRPFYIRFLRPVFMRAFCFLSVPLLLSMVWAYAGGEAHAAKLYLGVAVVLLIALYVGGLPFFYRQLFTGQYRRMCIVLRLGNWVAVGCTLLAILGVSGIVRLGEFGDVVGMLLWSAYAAQAATCLACAVFEREDTAARVVKLA